MNEGRRFLVWLFGLLGKEKAEANNKSMEPEETFLAELGLVPMDVYVCPNQCGCVTLVVGDEVIWQRQSDAAVRIEII